MTHPFEEGLYIIRHKRGPVLEDAAALLDDELLALIPQGSIRVAFTQLVWRLTYSGTGYKIQNVYTGEYLYVPEVERNAFVQRDKEKSNTWNIQADGEEGGEEIWRFVVPEHDLYWTWTRLIGGKDPANVKLEGSDGADDQYFTLQRYVGP